MGIVQEEPLPINELESLWIGVYVASIGLISCSLASFLSCIQEREDSSRFAFFYKMLPIIFTNTI